MILRIFIFLLGACVAGAGESERIKLDASVLADIPAKRHAALLLFAVTERDSTPEISEKMADYTSALKTLIQDLRRTYYWHSEFPEGLDETVQKRAYYLAGLHYPASPTTGASYYGSLIQRYTIRLYEDELVTIAYAVTKRFHDSDVVIVRGNAQSFASWKKEWDDAGDVNGGPNQAPEPTATVVTDPAAQAPRQP
jgi:hypothetical protein